MKFLKKDLLFHSSLFTVIICCSFLILQKNSVRACDKEIEVVHPGFIRPNIANFSRELPAVEADAIRFVSYNILASFLTDSLGPDQTRAFSAYATHSTWSERRTPLLDLLIRINPSVFNLQEVSFEQFHDILSSLRARQNNYAAVGHVSYTGKELSNIRDSSENNGFSVVTLYDTVVWNLEKNGTFWLKKDSDIPPSIDKNPTDLNIDLGFGDSDNYRNVEWSILTPKPGSYFPENMKLLVLTSHFSLTAQRSKCAALIVERLRLLMMTELSNVTNLLIMVSGDFNLFSDTEGSEAYSILRNTLKDYRDAPVHFGFAATFIGAESDKFHASIDGQGRIDPNALDFIGFSPEVHLVRSFSISGEFERSTGKLLEPLVSPMRTSRYTISDHCLIGADVKIKK